LKIRAEQMAVLQAQVEADFESKIISLLITSHQAAIGACTPDELHQRVCTALAKGRAHGFTWQSALAGFVVMMFELGPNFDQHPSFARALAIRLADENERIQTIYANVTDEDWQDARSFADPKAWHDQSDDLSS
jgi:hypothetical protein